MKKQKTTIVFLLSLLLTFLISCGQPHAVFSEYERYTTERAVESDSTSEAERNGSDLESPVLSEEERVPAIETEDNLSSSEVAADIPVYAGEPSTEINGNVPLFPKADKTAKSFEAYSVLDDLGRCGVAYACIGPDLMPSEERGSIGEIHPSGWHTVKYDGIDGDFLYNRCHLIAYSLTGENANVSNLITGTRYMNKEGMNPYEIEVANYIRDTGNHVLYRVTPIFEGDNLLASGVEMEAESIEDDEISFHVFCFNVQPGIEIDYATGESVGPEYTGNSTETTEVSEELVFPEDTTYILNTNTQRFHYMDCDSVRQMSDKNRLPTNKTRDELIEEGYQPCGSCKP